ncbi:MAG: ABC transporter [Chloroflexi bacterium]|nr:MAG: ABC transporter [Chloroflexota bacterium]
MTTDIGIRTTLKTSFEQAIQKTTDALKTEGFGVLTQIDVKTTLKEKINVDFRRYVILGACNPALAHRALSANADVGLLLPCNVTVQEAGDNVLVAAVDPLLMLGVLEEDAAVKEVALEAKTKLEKAIASLK